MRFLSHRLVTALAAVGLAAAAPAADAQSLSGDLTVDNAFTAYLSTSPTSTVGSAVVSGGDWTTTYSFGPTALTPGTNYWLQVAATNQGGPGMFVGDFTLTGPFLFANGGTTLTTNATNWTLQSGSFAGPPLAILDQGPNSGPSIWGARPGIDAAARFIWEAGNCGNCTIYFSTPIIAQAVPGIAPEPSTWALLGSGLVGLGAVARRRRKA